MSWWSGMFQSVRIDWPLCGQGSPARRLYFRRQPFRTELFLTIERLDLPPTIECHFRFWKLVGGPLRTCMPEALQLARELLYRIRNRQDAASIVQEVFQLSEADSIELLEQARAAFDHRHVYPNFLRNVTASCLGDSCDG